MRRFEFKAWDKQKKMWTNWKCYDNMFYFMDKYTGVWIRDDEFKRFVLLQCTGQKDKEGTEIYEGDIVEAWSEGSKHIGEVRKRIDGLYIIYPAYCNGFWGLKPNKAGKTTVEVIGNIYENPELLEEE